MEEMVLTIKYIKYIMFIHSIYIIYFISYLLLEVDDGEYHNIKSKR